MIHLLVSIAIYPEIIWWSFFQKKIAKLVALPLSAIRRSVLSDVLVKECITAQT